MQVMLHNEERVREDGVHNWPQHLSRASSQGEQLLEGEGPQQQGRISSGEGIRGSGAAALSSEQQARGAVAGVGTEQGSSAGHSWDGRDKLGEQLLQQPHGQSLQEANEVGPGRQVPEELDAAVGAVGRPLGGLQVGGGERVEQGDITVGSMRPQQAEKGQRQAEEGQLQRSRSNERQGAVGEQEAGLVEGGAPLGQRREGDGQGEGMRMQATGRQLRGGCRGAVNEVALAALVAVFRGATAGTHMPMLECVIRGGSDKTADKQRCTYLVWTRHLPGIDPIPSWHEPYTYLACQLFTAFG